MSDKIVLTDLRFHAYHGVFEEEQRFGAEFRVDIEISTTFGMSDDIAGSVDYGAVYHIAKNVVTGERFDLIETVAQHIATRVLALDRVQAVTVRVHKPQAPLPGVFGDVYVEIHRERHA